MRDFAAELSQFKDRLGFDPNLVEQGTKTWLSMRSGVVTASKADCLLAKPGTAKRDGYMAELVSEVATRLTGSEITAKALAWGKRYEDEARQVYEMLTFEHVKEVPFIYKDDSMRFGCSPDGLCSTYGLEIKCPYSTKTFIEFVCADKIKKEYFLQCQFSMWITGLDKWDFCNYDPRMFKGKLHCVTIERDDKIMSQLDEASEKFVSDMDAMLSKLDDVKFGDQWIIE